ncbi:hypothetical protein D3C71_1907510 [compost metagenome]
MGCEILTDVEAVCPTGVAVRQTQVLDGLRQVQVQLPNVLLEIQIVSVQVRFVKPAQLITVQPGL